MKKNVFGLVKNQEQAQRILSRLEKEGFSNESVSFLAYDRENTLTRKNARGELEVNKESFGNAKTLRSEMTQEKHTKAPEGATTGAVTGGVIGGSLGLLAGIGAIAIPGLGAFIAAGPLMAALSGSGLGGGLGLILGGLIGLGYPEYEAKKIEKHLSEGHFLITVDTQDEQAVLRAEDILKQEGATDISSASITSKV